MPNTTNFNWVTPADTDLVKDGAAAIRTLGNGVDASFVDLKGGTTNQVLAKNSNTDLDFKWVADASGIPATIFDAKGDIIAATAADTADRLAVGANGTVLTADSTTGTGLKWSTPVSGALTKISKQTISASSAVNINNVFSSTYRSYRIIFDATASNTDVNISMRLRVSGTDTNANYVDYTFINSGGSTAPESITDQFRLVRAAATGRNFAIGDFINPFSAEPTGYFGFGAGSHGYTNWTAGRHTASTSYDGFSILVSAGTITGEITIYGYEA